jgi:hypothetical protein
MPKTNDVVHHTVKVDPHKGIINTYKRADVVLSTGETGVGYAIADNKGSDEAALANAIEDARRKK